MISSGDTSIRKSKVISRRIFIVSIAKIIVFTGIIGRLFSLQVNENKKYLRLSDKNRLREWKLPPVRGEFFDYFGNTVAGNMEVYRLHVIPEQVGNFNNLIKFINSIEESNLVVDVHSLTMDIKKTIHVNFKIAVWGIRY